MHEYATHPDGKMRILTPDPNLGHTLIHRHYRSCIYGHFTNPDIY